MNELDLRLSRKLKKIARKLDELVEKEMGEKMGIALIVFPFAPDGSDPANLPKVEYQYISNLNRMHMHEAMRSLVKKWDGGHVDIPPHVKN